jgi:hypothetical protein
MYNSERVGKLSKIQPTFAENIQTNDQIMLGIEGDHLFPAKYRSSRPVLTVSHKVQNEQGWDVHAVAHDGHLHILKAGDISPTGCWEVTEKTFADMMSRKEERYRSTKAQNSIDERLAVIEAKQAEEFSANESFRSAIVDGMAAMASEIDKGLPGATFSSMFAQEYRNSNRAALQDMSGDVSHQLQGYESPAELW